MMKIIAGVDKEHEGIAKAAPGLRVGYLQQEPQLDASKTVFENVMDGLSLQTGLLAKFEKISAEFANPDADMDQLIAEQAEVQAQIDELNCWDLKHKVEIAMNALRHPLLLPNSL